MKPVEFEKAVAAGRIPPLVYLYGDEDFLVEQAYQRVVAKAVPEEGRDFNLQVYYGRDLKPEEVLDSCRTFPVFSPLRLVVIKDAHQLKAPELAAFSPYLSEPSPETILVFLGKSVDKRLSFFKEFKKKGSLVEFKKFYDNQVPGYIKNQVSAAGKNFTEEALALFCRRIGGSLGEIQAELNKLVTYLGDKPLIDVADVATVVSDTRNESVFDLVNAIGKRQPSQALRLLNRMIQDDEPPLRILTMIVRHFRQLWQASELMRLGADRAEMAKKMRINPYFIEGIVTQAKTFSSSDLHHAFAHFLEADLALKSSGAHAEAILERLLIELAGQGRE